MNKYLKYILIIVFILIVFRFFNEKKSSPEKFSEEDKKTLVLFKAEWCGHCNRFKEDWEKIKLILSKKNILTVTYDADDEESQKMMNNYQINSFPTLLLIQGDKSITYEGDRSIEDVISFASTS